MIFILHFTYFLLLFVLDLIFCTSFSLLSTTITIVIRFHLRIEKFIIMLRSKRRCSLLLLMISILKVNVFFFWFGMFMASWRKTRKVMLSLCLWTVEMNIREIDFLLNFIIFVEIRLWNIPYNFTYLGINKFFMGKAKIKYNRFIITLIGKNILKN